MKTLAHLSLAAGLLLVASPALAQYSYYSTPSYGTSYGSAAVCISLTAYQTSGSTDASTGGQVTVLQQFLNRTGYLSGISGYFDNGTLGAVINYQNSHGIPATGTVGPQTRAAINAQSCGSSPINTYNPGNSYTPPSYNPGYNYNQYPYNNYGYNIVPSISSLSVTSGPAGSVVTIYGTFSGTDSIVHFGSQVVPATLNSNSSLTFTVPSYSTGTYSVYVSNPLGSSNSVSFSVTNYGYDNCSYNNSYSYSYNSNCNCYPVVYNNYGSNYNYSNYNNCGSNNNYNGNGQPYVSSVSGPSSVSAGTSNTWSVSAYGQNGDPITMNVDWGDGSISNNNYSGSGYYNSNNNYSFSHSYSGNGNYTMRITVADSTNGSYSYATKTITVNGYCNGYNCNNGNSYGQPYISSLSTNSAHAGTTITIYGSNFSGNSVVYFGNSAYTPSAMTDSSIVVQVPYLSTGYYPIQVRNSNSSNSVSFNVY